MNFKEVFEILEIEPTSDKKKIKIAYSKMLKKYHPEEFPEMFIKINEAYEIALKYENNSFDKKNFENDKLEDFNLFEYMENLENNKSEEKFAEAFKILEMKPTADKKKIKKQYREVLKKYHQNNFENYGELFSKINEAYSIALEYEEHEFSKSYFENDDILKKIMEIFEIDEDSKKLENENNEFSDIFYEKNILEDPKTETYNWVANFKSIIVSHERFLEDYKEILNKFHNNFDEIEKKEILEIIKKRKMLDKAWVITEFERQFLLYNLYSTENVFEGSFWNYRYEFSNDSLNQIIEDFKSNDIEKVEKSYEEFISKYFNIKIFRLFGKSILLYSDEGIEDAGKGLKLGEFMLYKINQEFNMVSNYIRILNMSSKNGIGIELSSFAIQIFWYVFLGLTVSSIFMFPSRTVSIVVLGIIIATTLDWINIIHEKNFKWSKTYGVSSFLFIIMTITFGISLLRIYNINYETLLIPVKSSIILIIIYLLINLLLFVKMVKTSRLRYERLKELTKKIFNVFILEK